MVFHPHWKAYAAALERLDLARFIPRAAPPRAKATIAEAVHLKLSERDSSRVLDLLENPPDPPERLKRAARAGFTLE